MAETMEKLGNSISKFEYDRRENREDVAQLGVTKKWKVCLCYLFRTYERINSTKSQG